ncbi:uncharacterized protein LOC115443611 [Manduca sexta]|uniref:uncharacterized protein LOC115443611 n=1 Tax=Manduca sexta TaxID=7130 RepID=UPI001182DBC2|nr:uncharacterized protein LOC115443611 [Manduca sexta]
MPRRSSLKTLLIESMLFVSLFALVAHLSIHFWERYVIQTELSHMKYSLHSMKETINNIGNAYDVLHKDLKGLISAAENAISMDTSRKPEQGYKDKYTLDRRTLHNMRVQAMVKAKNERVGKSHTKFKELTYKNAKPIAINATTITKYPPKSTGIGSNLTAECCEDSCGRNVHKCYEVYNYCRDPRAILQH